MTSTRRLVEITVDPSINPRDGLDHKYIEYLKDIVDLTPAVVIVDTGEKELLADGFHRYAAYEAAGKDIINVKRRLGTEADARDLAIILNMTHGKRLTSEERKQAVLDYMARHPRMSHREVAKRLSLHHKTVDRIVKTDQQIGAMRHGTQPLPEEHEEVLAESRLPDQTKDKLRETAREKSWIPVQVRSAVQTVEAKGTKVNPEYADKVLEGKEEPVTFTPSGEPAFSVEQIQKGIDDVLTGDIQMRMHKALAGIVALQLIKPHELVDSLDEGEGKSLLASLEAISDWIEEVLKRVREKLEVI